MDREDCKRRIKFGLKIVAAHIAAIFCVVFMAAVGLVGAKHLQWWPLMP